MFGKQEQAMDIEPATKEEEGEEMLWKLSSATLGTSAERGSGFVSASNLNEK